MSKKIMISMPDELLADIDSAADQEHRSRSEFIREAARQYLTARSGKYQRRIDDPKVQKALEIMERIAAKPSSGWDAAEAVREIRDRDKPATDNDIT